VPSIRLTPKTSLRITKSYLEKLSILSLSYFELKNKFSHTPLTETSQSSKIQTTSLDQVLTTQIDNSLYNSKEKEVLLFLVNQLDEKGFLSDWNITKKHTLQTFGISQRQLYNYLSDFHKFEPAGVGAKDIQDFLRLQIIQYGIEDTNFEKLACNVIKQQSDLEQGNLQNIATALDSTEKEIEMVLFFIKNNLNYQLPREQYKGVSAQYIMPSLKVSLQNDQFTIKSLEDYDSISDPKIATYLEERQKLLETIIRYVLSFQSSTIFSSLEELIPVSQKETAEELGLSPSFISRIVNKKYILFNSKLIHLKQLFLRKLTSSHVSKFALKKIFKNPSYSSYSDQKISNELEKMGVIVSRRTVNHYRNFFKN
jgi:RNA polymerase sigma-54 factor